MPDAEDRHILEILQYKEGDAEKRFDDLYGSCVFIRRTCGGRGKALCKEQRV